MVEVSGRRLQERSHESTEANEAAGSGLDVGGSAGGVGAAASARAGGARSAGLTTGPGGVGARARARGASTGSGGGGKEESSAVVGADSDGAGLVDHGARASSRKEQGVDTRADSRDVSRERLRSDDSRLVGDSVGLLSNGAVNSRHASHDTQRVGLGEVGGLGSRVHGWRGRRALSRSNGESSSGDEDGGAHFGSVVITVGRGVVVCFFSGWIRDASMSDGL